MKHGDVLRRAWQVMWQYRVLWVFGMILALTTVSSGSIWLYDGYRLPDDAVVFNYHLSAGDQEWVEKNLGVIPPAHCTVLRSGEVIGCEGHIKSLPERWIATLLTVAGVLLVIGMIIVAIVLVFRYVSEVALIRMVGEYDKSGQKYSIRQGIRLGFSRFAWRLFLIDILTFGLVILILVLPFLTVLLPVPFMVSGSTPSIILGGLAIGGMFFVALAVVIASLAVTSLLVRFFRRACVLEDMGVLASIGRGFRLVRGHIADVGLMWLVMIAVDAVFPMLIVPTAILVAGVGLVVGGGSGIIAGLVAQFVMSPLAAVLTGLLVAIPVFLFTVVMPLLLLDGMRHVFQSSTWTITYRELRQLEASPLKESGQLAFEG